MRAQDCSTDYTIATPPIGALRRLLNTVRVPTEKRRLRLLRYLRDMRRMWLIAKAGHSRDGSLEQ